jgi:hypothetical protein
LASDATDGLPEHQGRCHSVGAAPPGYSVAPEEQRHRRGAAHEAAVEDEPAAREEQADRVAHERRPVLDHEPEPGGDEAAGGAPEHRGRREVRVVAPARELAPQHVPGRQEGDGEHQAEEVDRDRTEVKVVRDHPGARILAEVPIVRHSRLQRDRALRRACVPWCSACARHA